MWSNNCRFCLIKLFPCTKDIHSISEMNILKINLLKTKFRAMCTSSGNVLLIYLTNSISHNTSVFYTAIKR